MRKIIIALTLIFPLLSIAAPATFHNLMAESKKIRQGAAKADLATRKKELNILLEKVRANIEEYKKLNPDVAGPEEEKLLLFSYGLEIPQNMKNTNKDSCEEARDRLRINKLGTNAETGTLPPEGEESLAWINLLCK